MNINYLFSTPDDLFISISEYFEVKEIAQFPSVSKAFQQLAVFARAQIDQLDFAHTQISDQGLIKAIQLHPRIKRLDISYCDQISPIGIQFGIAALPKEMEEIKMDALPIAALAVTAFWQNMVLNLDFSTMRIFQCPYVLPRQTDLETQHLVSLIGTKLEGCQHLQKFDILRESITSPSVASYILSLPETLVDLDFRHIPLTNLLVDCILTTFDQEVIRTCNLTLNEVSEENVLQLFHFLPLSQMTEITLRGPSITVESYQLLTEKIKSNTTLKILWVDDPAPDVAVPMLTDLIQSIDSPNLQKLILFSGEEDGDFDQLTALKYQLFLKIASWKQIEHIATDGGIGPSPEELINTIPTLAEASFLFKDESTADQFPTLIPHYNNFPLETITAHYSELHNALDPNNPILSYQTLAHYDLPEHPNHREPVVLINFLERLIVAEHELLNERDNDDDKASQRLNRYLTCLLLQHSAALDDEISEM